MPYLLWRKAAAGSHYARAAWKQDGKQFSVSLSKYAGQTIRTKRQAKQIFEQWLRYQWNPETIRRIEIIPLFRRYDNDCRANQSPETYRADMYRLDAIEKWLTENRIKYLDQLTVDLIDQWKTWKRDQVHRGRKPKPVTINRTLQLLRAMTNKAVLWGMVKTSPLHGLTMLLEREKRTIQVLNDDQLTIIESHFSDPDRTFCRLMYDAGLRLGEVVYLTWGDISFPNKTLAIQWKDGIPFTPKGRQARVIPMTPGLVTALKGLPRKGRFVFDKLDWPDFRQTWSQRRRAGSPLFCKARWRKRVQDLFVDHGIPRVRLHDLRHTWATNFVRAGGSTSAAQSIAGWERLVTAEKYLHITTEDMRNGIAKLGDLRSK